jgi:hypothetical protein
MTQPPKIILIGAGRFGKNHLRILSDFHARGVIEFIAVIVDKEKSARELSSKIIFPVFTSVLTSLLKMADAVIVVTPSSTHFELVSRCIKFCNVFVEKPLVENSKQARKLIELAKKTNNKLMVGHIFRFHPAVEAIKKILKKRPLPISVEGSFVSPINTWRGEKPAFEELHWWDMMDYFFNSRVCKVWSSRGKSFIKTSIRYSNNIDANFNVGWLDKIKERLLKFNFKDECLTIDFQTGIIILKGVKTNRKIVCLLAKEPLKSELETFLRLINNSDIPYPDGVVGERVVSTTNLVTKSSNRDKDRVAVIGGGIFGVTAAIALSDNFEVTLFEKNKNLLLEATRLNQYRHHSGYHYPRSPETVQEIVNATKDFEEWYGKAVKHDFKSYYCVAKKNSLTSKKDFIKFCSNFDLPCEDVVPDSKIINGNSIDGCFRVKEGIYNYKTLFDIITKKLKKKKIVLKLNSSVTNSELMPDGQKKLYFTNGCMKKNGSFDYVINCTYSNYNLLPNWLGFAKKDIELRFKEVILIRIPKQSPFSATIVDGPFATIVTTGENELFTFGDVPLSIRAIGNGQRGNKIIMKKLPKCSLWGKMRDRCKKWFPILDRAEYVKSMYSILPVGKSSKKNDSRPSEVTYHGFGCYSVLGGKVITSVTTGKDILKRIKNE